MEVIHRILGYLAVVVVVIADGEGEPSVGIPADQRRAGEARDPRLRDEYRDASSPLLASVRPPAGA